MEVQDITRRASEQGWDLGNKLIIKTDCSREDRTQAQMRAIVPMLVMVVTVFILCWAPILIFEVNIIIKIFLAEF